MFIYFQAAVSALLAVSVLYVGNQPVTDISEAVIADRLVDWKLYIRLLPEVGM